MRALPFFLFVGLTAFSVNGQDIRGSPQFIVTPRDVGVREGDRLELFCRASGKPMPKISWVRQKTGRTLTWAPRIQLQNNDTVLLFTQVLHTDYGYYTCRAHNQYGRIETKPFEVRVIANEPPRILQAPKDKRVLRGTQATFTCTATGDPRPVMEWLYNGSPIPSRTGHYEISTEDGRTLKINDVQPADDGRYWCQANNKVGSMSTDFTVSVVDNLNGVQAEPEPRSEPEAEPETEPEAESKFDSEPEPGPENQAARDHHLLSRPRATHRPSSINRRPAYLKPRTAQASSQRVQNGVNRSCFQIINKLFNAINQSGVTQQRQTRPTSNLPPVGAEDQTIIRDAIRLATANVDRGINQTKTNLHRGGAKTPSQLLSIFRFPGPQAIELARTREIYEQSLALVQQSLQTGLRVNTSAEPLPDIEWESVLSVSHVQMLMELSGCTPGQFRDTCDDMCFHGKYRSYDGQCNNLGRPMQGVSLMPFSRRLDAIYENGFNTPVGWDTTKKYYGYEKPNARQVSRELLSTEKTTSDTKYSSMVMQWGQFVDHDLSFAAAAPSRFVFESGAVCNLTCDNRAPCFNIPMSDDDPRQKERQYIYSMNGTMPPPCLEFERSSAVCGSGSTSLLFQRVAKREQMNMITSYLDGSNVYGSNEQSALDLRDLFSDHGLLRFDIVSRHAQKPYLPFNRDAPMDCRRKQNVTHAIRCFLAGDLRANEQLGLLATHTLWLREHNRIAAHFLVTNAHWDGERIYQETRKIVGAQLQHITYAHWLPLVLGEEGMAMVGDYAGYREKTDASVSNVFATAAFRFGHTLIQPMLKRLDKNYDEASEGHLPLHHAFFAPERLLSEGGIDPILRGLYAQFMKSPRPDQLINTELTEKLFGKHHEISLDLAALNIQRGRDHALPGYLQWRDWCDMPEVNNWDDLREDIPDEMVRNKLRKLYGHPGNIDLFAAGLVERKLPGALVGPTFACIIADQFRRTRDGDRFWYERLFSGLQLDEIRRSSLSSIICHNSDDINMMPNNVFIHHNNAHKDYLHCQDIPKINLNVWQDCSCQSTCGASNMDYLNEENDIQSLNEKVQMLEERLKDLERLR